MVSMQSSAASVSINEWNILWIKVVALAWRSEAFEKELLTDAHAALAKHFKFELPPGIELRVQYVDPTRDATHSEGEVTSALQQQNGFNKTGTGTGTWTLPSSQVVLPLPPKPQDINDHAIALATLMDWYHHENCCGNPCCS